MKIWITRNSASSIMFGGLERLFIWFRKPIYMVEIADDNYRDTPFEDISIDKTPHYKYHGWYCFESMWVGNSTDLSFGKIFGYSDGDNAEIAKFVWAKLCDHFNNEPFDNWDKMENEGLVKIQDFLLELDLDITLS